MFHVAHAGILSERDKAVISYCYQNGTSAADLATAYQRTTQRIHQIGSQSIWSFLSSVEAETWFYAGIYEEVTIVITVNILLAFGDVL